MSRLNDKINIHSNNIDLLRFLAAVLVIISHAYPLAINDGDILKRLSGISNFSMGGLAVAIFFFLSGLYVTKSLEKTDTIGMFLLKRCKRIFPQMVVLILATIFILGPAVTSLKLSEYFSSVQTYLYLLNIILIPVHNLPGVFINNPYDPSVNGALWTMPVEFACYLVLAFIAWFAKIVNKDRKIFDILAVVMVAVIYLFIGYGLENSFLISVVRPVVCFFEGVIFYDFKEHIVLNPGLGIVMFIISIMLISTRIFSTIIILLFPYSIISISLGLPQMRYRLDIFGASYEMYLVVFLYSRQLCSQWGEYHLIRIC